MSRNNILITGASGYLGGTLLNRLKTADLPAHNAIFALVRTSSQAEAVKQYGAKALTFDAYNAEAVKAAVLKYELNIVFALHDAFKSDSQANFIEALGELRKTGKEVHFLHVSIAFQVKGELVLTAERPQEPRCFLHTSAHPSTNHSRTMTGSYTRFKKASALRCQCCR